MNLFIFDVDGVIETEKVLFAKRREKQFEAIMKKRGCSFEEAKKLFRETQGKLPPEKSIRTADVLKELGFTRKDYFAMLNAVDPKGIIEEQPHCCDVLAELGKKHALVTFSNAPHQSLLKTLDVVGATHYFDKIYSAEDFKESKPNPEALKQIIEEQGFSKEHVVVMGDSLKKDVLPALHLGLKAFLFDPVRKNDLSCFEDVRVITDWRELLKLF
jgi:HAD superfamily hydrolase (TIGR01549 family)